MATLALGCITVKLETLPWVRDLQARLLGTQGPRFGEGEAVQARYSLCKCHESLGLQPLESPQTSRADLPSAWGILSFCVISHRGDLPPDGYSNITKTVMVSCSLFHM